MKRVSAYTLSRKKQNACNAWMCFLMDGCKNSTVSVTVKIKVPQAPSQGVIQWVSAGIYICNSDKKLRKIKVLFMAVRLKGLGEKCEVGVMGRPWWRAAYLFLQWPLTLTYKFWPVMLPALQISLLIYTIWLNYINRCGKVTIRVSRWKNRQRGKTGN